jgi:hypothetical protein
MEAHAGVHNGQLSSLITIESIPLGQLFSSADLLIRGSDCDAVFVLH